MRLFGAKRDLVLLPLCFDLVYGLVAVIPGIQLLILRVVVETGVAGVALGEEQHRTLLTATQMIDSTSQCVAS